MNPTTPTHPAPAMSHGGTFMRPGAVGWGPASPGELQPELAPAVIEHALAAAAKDPDQVTDLLDELSRGRLWLPLPDDERPVTDGSAVLLPTVTYLGAEFVPAFTSARQLAGWHARTQLHRRASAAAEELPDDPAEPQSPDGPFAAMPHIVVPAARAGPAAARAEWASRSIQAPRPASPSTRKASATWPPPGGSADGAGPGAPASGRPDHAAGRVRVTLRRHPRCPAGRPGLAVGTRRRRGPGHLGHAARPALRSRAPPGHRRDRAGRPARCPRRGSPSTSRFPARASRTGSTSGSPRRPSPFYIPRLRNQPRSGLRC